MSRSTQSILGQLSTIFGGASVSGLGETSLLERFATQRDEAALAAIITRHGPMVLGVCRRLLRDEHDVEDAFQATFLIFVRRAGSLRDGDRLGPWLHGVAHRVAVRARAQAAQRYAREQTMSERSMERTTPPCTPVLVRELREILDDELARLPEALRAPLVLCYLEGMTHDQAAELLRWPVGTVRSRMARGRDRLRGRLARRGLGGEEASLSAVLAAAPMSQAVFDRTIRASLGFASHHAAAATRAAAVSLAQRVLQAMTFAKLKLVGVLAIVSLLTIAGAETYAWQFGGMGGFGPPRDAAAKKASPPGTLLQRLDSIQARLEETGRSNAHLQKEVEDLRAKIQSLLIEPTTKETITQETTVGPMTRSNQPAALNVPTNAAPTYVEMSNGISFLVISPAGDKVTVYYPQSKNSKPFRLAEDGRTPRSVSAVMNPTNYGTVALRVVGPRITRLAVFQVHTRVDNGIMNTLPDGTWYPIELREPFDLVASPMVCQGTIAYVLGRRIYAFSTMARRWDVLEFPDPVDNRVQCNEVGTGLKYEHDGRVYKFNSFKGTWNDPIDLRAILDAPETKDDEKAPPESPQ